MLTVDEAFRKFKSRLELNDSEQKNASARQTEVRDYLDTKFAIDRSFLTGSYARYTKTKPLKDIDIFFVLKESERHYRDKAPSVVHRRFLRRARREVRQERRPQAEPLDQCRFRRCGRRRGQHRLPRRQRRRRAGLRGRRRLRDSRHRHRQVDQDQPRDPRREGDRRASGLFQRVEGPRAHGEVLEQQPEARADKPVKPSFLIEVMALAVPARRLAGPLRLRDCRRSSRRSPTASSTSGPTPPGSVRRSATAWISARKQRARACLLPRAARPALPSITPARDGTATR